LIVNMHGLDAMLEGLAQHLFLRVIEPPHRGKAENKRALRGRTKTGRLWVYARDDHMFVLASMA